MNPKFKKEEIKYLKNLVEITKVVLKEQKKRERNCDCDCDIENLEKNKNKYNKEEKTTVTQL